MKKQLLIGLTAVFFLNGMTTVASATLYDHGDAPLLYGDTTHQTATWQRLGDNWTKESTPLRVNNDDDDGVSWSIDGGTTWGYEAVSLGKEIIFKFDMTRAGFGVHEYDQLKAWVDWNQDGYWDNANELIIAEQWFKHTIEDGDTYTPDNMYPNGADTDAVLQKSFIATLTISENAVVGDTWLRARVSCDHTSFEDSNPYIAMWQGEVEDWILNINNPPPGGPPSEVPEPATLLLFGTGLIGFAGLRFRKKNN